MTLAGPCRGDEPRARIQQLGTPEQIYNDPKTLFVAGFMGSPAMKPRRGSDRRRPVRDRRREHRRGRGAGTRDGGWCSGVRPEDLAISEAWRGELRLPRSYASELTGRERARHRGRVAGPAALAAKGRPGTRARRSANLSVIRVQPDHTYLFDASSGKPAGAVVAGPAAKTSVQLHPRRGDGPLPRRAPPA